jgi:predicted ATP-dependent endonuclease of OLD family
VILRQVQVRMFRNVVDSSPVAIEPGVTCLVGKNESGKTAFLEALHRLNPAGSPRISLRDQYPRWRWKKDEKTGQDLGDLPFVTATFELLEADRSAVAKETNVLLPAGTGYVVSQTYDGECTDSLEVNGFRQVSCR